MEFRDSVDKHGIPREDTMYAMQHAEVIRGIEGRPGEPGETFLYIGHPHAHTERYIEVIATVTPPRTVVVFHSMPLRSLFTHLLS